MGDFNCDDNAKEILGKVLIDHYSNLNIETAATEEYAHCDVLFTATTKSGKIGKYAVEIKERNKPAGFYEDEFINIDKDFQGYRNSGYTILWCALYDDVIFLWDYDKTPKIYKGKYKIKKHNVLNEPKILQERWAISYKDAKEIKYDKERYNN